MKILILIFILVITGYSSISASQTTVNAGDDPNFTIVANSDAGFTTFSRKVIVFGIPIYAVSSVEDIRLLHTANLMAQYLDNNEDGVVDNQLVLDSMKNANAFLFMWKNESESNFEPPANTTGQDLGNDETIPAWHSNGHTGQFDAALEEVWHIITNSGYASAYPSVFGENIGSELANSMDIARGGQFITIPSQDPPGAWYTYDDQTCDYPCMVTEYIYWSMSSILGAQQNRLSEIQDEWRLNTPELVQSTDTTIYNLLTNPIYNFPTVLPDGTYRRDTVASYSSTARTLQIPVVQVGEVSYSASLSDNDNNGRYTLDTVSVITNQSNQSATYNPSSSILNLPLIRVTNEVNNIVLSYSAIMQRHSDGEFTVSNASLVQ